MTATIFILLFAVIAVVLIGAGLVAKRRENLETAIFAMGAGALLLVASLVWGVMASFYTQDVGESKVQVSWSGELQGQTTEPGVHFKWPWVNVRTFDVRNNIVAYVGDGADNYSGSTTSGPQITFQDREGVTGNMDLTVRYSLQGDKVLDIYSQYKTQDEFVSKVIAENVRAIARESVSTRSTIEVYNNRGGVMTDILTSLENKLDDIGVTVEDVNLQEIRYSAEVVARFDEAQAARIAIDRAEAEQEASRVQAETLVIQAEGTANAAIAEAQGQAEANRLLTQSLTPEVLTQRYIDALKASGKMFIVPEGTTPFLQVPSN